VNGRVHSLIQAIPAERLKEERPLMRPLPSLRPPLCRGELRKDFQLAKTADFEMAIDTAPVFSSPPSRGKPTPDQGEPSPPCFSAQLGRCHLTL
jgi:hypothetical protein